jgi:signal transduction histidine kinase/CheY-like chemotaxis protein
MNRRIALFVLAAAIPVVLLLGTLSYISLQRQQVEMRAEAQFRTRQIMDRVDGELVANIRHLRLLAESPILDGDNPDLARFHDLAVRFSKWIPLWDRVILADRENQQIINTARPFGSELPKVVELESHSHVLNTGEPVIGGVGAPGPLASDQVPRAHLRVPVSRDGRVRYVLTALVSINGAGSILVNELNPNWAAFLVDSEDTIVSSPRFPARVGEHSTKEVETARALSTQGLYIERDPNGVEVVSLFQKSPATGWSAHVAIPRDLYDGPSRWANVIAAVSVATFLALAAGVVLLLRKEMEERARRARLMEHATRLEALGRMTGGVAHDFNNLLMVILTSVDLMAKRVDVPGVAKYLDRIRMAAKRGSDLSKSLLVFSRGGRGQAEVVELNEHLRRLADLARQSLRGDITLDLQLSSKALFVEVDTTELDLAILNLVSNAKDALPQGGTVTLATCEVFAGGKAHAELRCRDNGTGIPSDVLPHVLEPFFTTKDVGQGTGLGLSQVYGFVKAVGGSTSIDSVVGQGTTVTLWLPQADPPQALAPSFHQAESPQEARLSITPSVITILLVDDNHEVRSGTAEQLRSEGFRVVEQHGPVEALKYLEQDTPAIVVSDIVMPGEMDGVGLGLEIRRRWPKLPVVLVSGYSTKWQEAEAAGFPLMRKPYEAKQLIDAISARIRA